LRPCILDPSVSLTPACVSSSVRYP
jgi:hypothetical protein